MLTRRHWRGRLFFGSGRLLYAGPMGATGLHAHHSYQLVLALSGTLTLADAKGARHTGPAALVPPGVRHSVAADCADAVLLHVMPEETTGRGLKALGFTGEDAPGWGRSGEPLAMSLPAAAPTSWDEAEALAQRMLEALQVGSVRPRPVHPAIMRLLHLLPGLLDEDVRTAALAARVGLSAGRLSHLFGQEVGLPLRPYVLWLRLQRAAEHLAAGDTLTEAAHTAGFSDSAHLSHVFRRTFGLAPSDVAQGVQWVLPPTR